MRLLCLEKRSSAICKTVLAPFDPFDAANRNKGLLHQTTFSTTDIQSKIFLKAAV